MSARTKLYMIQKVLGQMPTTEWDVNCRAAFNQLIADSKGEDQLTSEQQISCNKVFRSFEEVLE